MPTFQAGYNAAIFVAQYSLGAYFNSLDVERSVAMLETTTFGQSSKTRIPGLKDGTAKASGYFDGTTGAVADAFAAALALSGGVAATFAPLGDTAGNIAYLGKLHEGKYSAKLAVAGLVSTDGEWSTQGNGLFVPLAQGVMHHALAAISGTITGTSQDGTASSSTGWRATIHVTAASGSSPTLDAKLQDSADNITFADVTGGAFTQLTTTGSQVLYSAAVTTTLRRYVQLVYTLGGGTPSFTVATAVARG